VLRAEIINIYQSLKEDSCLVNYYKELKELIDDHCIMIGINLFFIE
jgi:hypothetical protein